MCFITFILHYTIYNAAYAMSFYIHELKHLKFP